MYQFLALASQIVLAAGDEGEQVKEGGSEAIVPGITSGVLVEWAWLIVVVPIVAAFVIAFWGKKMPFKGWEAAWGAIGFVGLYGTVLFVLNASQGILYEGTVEIAEIGDFTLEWGWMVDGLSIMMYFLIGVVGFLVFTYAKGYMKGDIRFTWFFASFSLFAGGMLVLVSAPNLIQLIVGWELVGVSSYLLIAHYWEDYANVDAGNKAFMVNKVADAALFLGAIIMAVSVGSFSFNDVIDVVVKGEEGMLSQYAFWAGLLIFIGAMGKSAQFPLHVWLPDAMAGPTPVSALMHAATMVTAGVFLLGRLFPFYIDEAGIFAGDVRNIIIVIGGLTLFLAGLLAIVQNDIKKVLAYSTVSQLGYMVAAMGAGAYTAGLFHLFTHAFFKGLLFLGAGSVIHAVHSNNMSDMGGLRKKMPITFWTFIAGTLALIGIFPFAGFFSKDEILASMKFAGENGQDVANFILILGIAGAFITAFYMTRLVALTFFGTYKGHATPHESPKMMSYPLIGLAFFAVTAGWINFPGVYTGFTTWLATRVPLTGMGDHHAEGLDWSLVLIVTPVVLIGVAIGWWLYGKDKKSQAARDTFRIPVLWPLFENLYYIDDFYMNGIVRPTMGPIANVVLWWDRNVVDGIVNGVGLGSLGVAKAVRVFDQNVVDGFYNEIGAGVDELGSGMRKSFTGRVQQYAAFSFVGVVVIAVLFIIL
ncbi:MAG: NADH-quinone oxidoreductase subunit L [Acidimicrobiia bacterium]|nr:MAG: NADH-quinone oxidoreductase subunit L [Acidimicrobiia bacterium]